MRGNLNVGASVQSHYFVEESDKIVSNDVVLVYGIVEMYSNIALAVMFRLCLSILHTPNTCFVNGFVDDPESDDISNKVTEEC